MSSRNAVAEQAQTTTEIPGVAAKLGVIWAGTLWGIKISDLVLLATLLYTILQIGVLVWEKIVKPILAHRREQKELENRNSQTSEAPDPEDFTG